MKSKLVYRAFSLTELLIALAILSIIVAIIAPRFWGLQDQAKDVVAAQLASQLNSTYAEWEAAGGFINTTAAKTSDVLYALNTPSDPVNPLTISWPVTDPVTNETTDQVVVSDNLFSGGFKLNLPKDVKALVVDPVTGYPLAEQSVVTTDDYSIVFDPNTKQFTVITAEQAAILAKEAADEADALMLLGKIQGFKDDCAQQLIDTSAYMNKVKADAASFLLLPLIQRNQSQGINLTNDAQFNYNLCKAGNNLAIADLSNAQAALAQIPSSQTDIITQAQAVVNQISNNKATCNGNYILARTYMSKFYVYVL